MNPKTVRTYCCLYRDWNGLHMLSTCFTAKRWLISLYLPQVPWLQGWAKSGPKVGTIFQASSGRSDKQQNSPIMGPIFLPIPVDVFIFNSHKNRHLDWQVICKFGHFINGVLGIASRGRYIYLPAICDILMMDQQEKENSHYWTQACNQPNIAFPMIEITISVWEPPSNQRWANYQVEWARRAPHTSTGFFSDLRTTLQKSSSRPVPAYRPNHTT